jgi:hypothetical protein
VDCATDQYAEVTCSSKRPQRICLAGVGNDRSGLGTDKRGLPQTTTKRIRADREDGGAVTRPRAADDFPIIRSRMMELRRERDQLLADQKGRSPVGPRPYHRATTDDAENRPDLDISCSIHRTWVR